MNKKEFFFKAMLAEEYKRVAWVFSAFSILKEDISIGICGATSTPMSQMEAVARNIIKLQPQMEVEKAAF